MTPETQNGGRSETPTPPSHITSSATENGTPMTAESHLTSAESKARETVDHLIDIVHRFDAGEEGIPDGDWAGQWPTELPDPDGAWELLGIEPQPYRDFLATTFNDARWQDEARACALSDGSGSGMDVLEYKRGYIEARIRVTETAIPLILERLGKLRGVGLEIDGLVRVGGWSTGITFRCPECRKPIDISYSGNLRSLDPFAGLTFDHGDDHGGQRSCPTNDDSDTSNAWFLDWLGLGAFNASDETGLDLAFLDGEDDQKAPRWLVPGMFAAGDYWSLFGPSEVGKSLLALDWALQMARNGQRVLYLDRENAKELIQGRLKRMGVRREDFANLMIKPFVEIKDLATAAGAAELHAMVEKNSATVVILDTISKFSETGQAVQSDRWQKIYNHSFVPLLNQGVCVGQLDHTGLGDKTRERDSNAKRDNVSIAWALTWRGKDRLTLTRAKNRPGYSSPGSIAVTRVDEPFLTHHFGDSVPDDIRRALEELERLNVPARAGRPTARAALDAAGISIADRVLEQAIRLRKGSE